MDLRNQQVHFKISDIYVPDPQDLLWQLHSNDFLEGRVIDLSDSGERECAFVVVQVEGLEQPIVVPVDRLCEASK